MGLFLYGFFVGVEFVTEGFLIFNTHRTKKNPTSLSQWGFSIFNSKAR